MEEYAKGITQIDLPFGFMLPTSLHQSNPLSVRQLFALNPLSNLLPLLFQFLSLLLSRHRIDSRSAYTCPLTINPLRSKRRVFWLTETDRSHCRIALGVTEPEIEREVGLYRFIAGPV